MFPIEDHSDMESQPGVIFCQKGNELKKVGGDKYIFGIYFVCWFGNNSSNEPKK